MNKKRISRYFKREEFACGCGCGFAAVDMQLLMLLGKVRGHFNKPVTITSACRCETHNRNVGGSENSKHKLGIAANIQVKDIPPSEVYNYIDSCYPNTLGLGSYNSFTHVDVREKRARWSGK